MSKLKIGVFDSGVGGLSVVKAIQKALPEAEIIYAEDKKNIPYGNKTPDKLYELVLPILNTLSKQGCEVIVIACNTVTTTIIERLREEIPLPLVGMEPMVKPAVKLSKTKTIAVCATPATLASARYAWLKDTYAKGVNVVEPDCSDWAYMIENSKVDHQKIHERINDALAQHADVIVLACTHYHWIAKDIQKLTNKKAVVLQPETAVLKQLKKVIDVI